MLLHVLFPETVEKATLHLVREWHFGFRAEAQTDGNLFTPAGRDASGARGHRKARTTLPRMLAWGARHLLKRTLDPAPTSIEPHGA